MYNQYEFLQLFTSLSITQPYFRTTNKLAYTLSQTSFKDTQCAYPISKKEIINYLLKYPDSFTIFVFQNNKYGNRHETAKLEARSFTNSDYSNINKSFSQYNTNHKCGDFYQYFVEFSIENRGKNKSVSKNNPEICATLINYVNSIEDFQNRIFIDPVSSYNIYSERISCLGIIDQYAKKMVINDFKNNINILSENIKRNWLLKLYIDLISNIFIKPWLDSSYYKLSI